MKQTAIAEQAKQPPGYPAGLPLAPQSSLTIALGATATLALAATRLVVGPFDQQALRRILLVAAPLTIVTSYPTSPPQGATSYLGGFTSHLVTVVALALQGSIIAVASYSLSVVGLYREGRYHRQIRQRLAPLVPQRVAGQPLDLKPGVSALAWGQVHGGQVVVQRRRWGPARLEAVGTGQYLRPTDVVIGGRGWLRVQAPTDLETVDQKSSSQQLSGVIHLRPGHTPIRFRRQALYWSSLVGLVSMLLTGDVYRLLGPLLAGAPTYLDVVGGATAASSSAKWSKKGVLAVHPLSLVGAGEVQVVLFDEPQTPDLQRTAELAAIAAQLRQRGYQVGLLTGGAAEPGAQVARAIGAHYFFSGPAEERAHWVADHYSTGQLAAVVGRSPTSVPAMVSGHLAVAEGRQPEAATVAHLVLEAPLMELPTYLAENQQTNRAERNGATIAKSLMVGATVAAGLGLLAATNIVTVTSLLGLGMAGLKRFLGRRPGRQGG